MRNHPVAFWTGFTAFCGNLAGIKILEVIGQDGDTAAQVIGAVFLSLAVGAVAYGRERLKDAKEGWDGNERRAPERREPPGPTP
jgi:hypothetical protein